MKTIRTHHVLLIAALALLPLGSARADQSTSQIAFSDPSKPGTLKIHVWHGEVSVHGTDAKEISVSSDSADESPTPRKDGMRVLSSSAGFVLSEKNNVATLEYGAEGWTGGSATFVITVPSTTSIIVANSARGDLTFSDISGDIDVRSMSGDVRLDDISGGALVETMNGEINVRVKALAEGRPLSFTSMHGEIAIHLPESSKANIRFRTHRGVILTNFDSKALVTKTEVSHGSSRVSRREMPEKPEQPEKPEKPESPDTVAAPAAPAAEAAAARDDDSDWHAEVRDSMKMAADEAAMAAREAADALHEGMIEIHAEFGGAMPPLPPMTGGKVVSGTLNGGGVSIQAATLNGDITLKKSE
jgi:hypothetical protein